MAKFCTRCGRPLQEGGVCECQKTGINTGAGANTNINIGADIESYVSEAGDSDTDAF